MENQVRCPKCGSTQLTANKKGFSAGKALGGAVLTGGIGLLAGGIGSDNIIITCLACGNQFKPGDGPSFFTRVESSLQKQIDEAEAKRIEQGLPLIPKPVLRSPNDPPTGASIIILFIVIFLIVVMAISC